MVDLINEDKIIRDLIIKKMSNDDIPIGERLANVMVVLATGFIYMVGHIDGINKEDALKMFNEAFTKFVEQAIALIFEEK